MKQPSSIVITGASSGIGQALAIHYAFIGRPMMLTGRDAGRLEDVARRCRAKGAEVTTAVLDVANRAAMADALIAFDDENPVDLIIANAGISGGTGGADADENIIAADRAIFDVNVTGVFNTLEPLIPRMTARGRGQMAVMASLASFSGWPGAPGYAASKGAVRLYAEGLRGALAPHGVRVNAVCPGFVKSRMTDVNDFPMPFFMQADKAARIIARGLARNHARIAFPWQTYMMVGLIGLLPGGLVSRLLSRFPEKPATRPDAT